MERLAWVAKQLAMASALAGVFMAVTVVTVNMILRSMGSSLARDRARGARGRGAGAGMCRPSGPGGANRPLGGGPPLLVGADRCRGSHRGVRSFRFRAACTASTDEGVGIDWSPRRGTT